MGRVLSLEEFGLEDATTFGNKRVKCFLRESPVRNNIRNLYLKKESFSKENFARMFRWSFGIQKLRDAKDFCEATDCQNWAFDEVGLSHYTYREAESKAHDLYGEDFDDMSMVEFPSLGNIVAYGKKGRLCHWGVVREVESRIVVDSKWGEKGHLYRHLINRTLPLYGDYVMFFEKKD